MTTTPSTPPARKRLVRHSVAAAAPLADCVTLQPGAQAATLPAIGAGAPAAAARDLGREILAAADVARGAGAGRAG
ncbi:hypothetical protein OHA79_14155 [Streptomyces sp. NBC_00841]|uniref:hypothetical protein n=1 Tax=Streptomyces sp. NBC_00841 TaxID=2975847 RepID=UPI002DDB8734|nr:hypothetical protein [Streptomyces sp. NBC_00841]WRZ98871.1 hypothetical protein OHA79_14155 [Streptomyces sp. NBC_00841]